MVTDQQVRRLFDVQNRYEYQYQVADAAGFSRKTAHKYLKGGKLPSQSRVGHTWPTRQDPFADDWATALTALRAFVAREGHAHIPQGHVEGSFRLGPWVAKRRSEYAVGRLDLARAAELQALPGWTWDPRADRWVAALASLRAFVEREGHARVPSDHVEGSLRLGSWVGSRRGDHKLGRLEPARVAALEALPGWTWDPRADDWAAGLAALRAFVAREGHARVPQRLVDGHLRLGAWVTSRRVDYRQGRLDPARAAELEAIPGWSWGRARGSKIATRRS